MNVSNRCKWVSGVQCTNTSERKSVYCRSCLMKLDAILDSPVPALEKLYAKVERQKGLNYKNDPLMSLVITHAFLSNPNLDINDYVRAFDNQIKIGKELFNKIDSLGHKDIFLDDNDYDAEWMYDFTQANLWLVNMLSLVSTRDHSRNVCGLRYTENRVNPLVALYTHKCNCVCITNLLYLLARYCLPSRVMSNIEACGDVNHIYLVTSFDRLNFAIDGTEFTEGNGKVFYETKQTLSDDSSFSAWWKYWIKYQFAVNSDEKSSEVFDSLIKISPTATNQHNICKHLDSRNTMRTIVLQFWIGNRINIHTDLFHKVSSLYLVLTLSALGFRRFPTSCNDIRLLNIPDTLQSLICK